MADRPILFSAPMVRALLAEREALTAEVSRLALETTNLRQMERNVQTVREHEHKRAEAALAEVARLTAALEREEKSHEATINQRDRAEDAADKLSQAIGGYAVGDHSNINCPWANALSMGIDMSAEIARLTAALVQSRAETQAALAGCVKIEPLVWQPCTFAGQPASFADTEFGPWMVVAYSGRNGRWAHTDPQGEDSDDDWGDDSGAKAAAQAEYEARTRAAIQIDITLQQRANEWALACFGVEIVSDKTERTHRFLEEALELAQACGCTKGEAEQLVDYVFARDQGEVAAEVGDVLIALAVLCTAHGIDMDAAGHKGLDRCWANIEKTRAKHAAKPRFSPLPVAIQPDTSKLALVREAFGNLVNHDVFQDEEYLSDDLVAKLSAARTALATIGEDPRHD